MGRTGKPVEISALWYNALCGPVEFARRPGEPAGYYDALAKQTRGERSARFWNEAMGYCYDVIDGPEGDDPALVRSSTAIHPSHQGST